MVDLVHSFNVSDMTSLTALYMYIPFVISMVESGQTKVTQFELAPAIKEYNTHRDIHGKYIFFVCMDMVSYHNHGKH